ncbi:MAG: peptide chain release factor N(5)-glutamine methyltransferase [Fibrobacter sp.]|nr:peptide chain release factor N(5)-glutamine methyltransferase [Fibrobacter sp.]
MQIGEALQYLYTNLKPSLKDFARPQAEEILLYILKCSRSELYSNKDRILTDNQTVILESILSQRLNGKPLQYILGSTFFYSREFRISQHVLIPRPDTEILVEQVLSNEQCSSCFFADIGTGSGIIACILTEERKGWHGVGIDISIKALEVARGNMIVPFSLVCADLLSAFKPLRQFDFLVSNPPYIAHNQINSLDPEVLDYEPALALFGGDDGLGFYRKLSNDAKGVLKPGGRIYCEIGYDQGSTSSEIFMNAGWSEVKITADYGRNPRVLEAKLL